MSTQTMELAMAFPPIETRAGDVGPIGGRRKKGIYHKPARIATNNKVCDSDQREMDCGTARESAMTLCV
jgi:hypothetical protein